MSSGRVSSFKSMLAKRSDLKRAYTVSLGFIVR